MVEQKQIVKNLIRLHKSRHLVKKVIVYDVLVPKGEDVEHLVRNGRVENLLIREVESWFEAS